MISTITGSNDFLRHQKLDQLVGEFIAKHGPMSVEKIDCQEAEMPRIIESLTAYSLFSNDKLVVLRGPGVHKKFSDDFDKLATNIPDTTKVIIVEKKLDKRTAYYKLLKSKTNLYDFAEPAEYETVKWIAEYTKKLGGSISRNDADYLYRRIGPNQQLIAKEIEKLATYQTDISSETIDLLTEKTPQGSVFELLDTAFSGNLKRTLDMYKEQREMRVEPLAILGMIAWQLNILAIVKTANNRDSNEISRQAKLNPFVVQKANALTRRLTLKTIRQLVSEALRLDVKLKRESIDADEAMNLLLIGIASK